MRKGRCPLCSADTYRYEEDGIWCVECEACLFMLMGPMHYKEKVDKIADEISPEEEE